MNLGSKILVIGSSASGKTTFGRKLQSKLNIQFYEHDYYHWLPNWEERPREDYKKMLREVIQKPEWIMDGLPDMAVDSADTIIWLDFPFSKVMYRVISRSLTRALTGKRLYHDNRETLRLVFSKDSMIIYVMNSYKSKKQNYQIAIGDDRFRKINWIRIKNRKDEKKFWKSLD